MTAFAPKTGFDRVILSVAGRDDDLVIESHFETDDPGLIAELEQNDSLKRVSVSEKNDKPATSERKQREGEV